jgi:zinc protease
VLGLGLAIVNRRLAAIAEAENPPFRSAALAQYQLLEATEVARAQLVVAPGMWRRGLEAVEAEWRRALLYGFSPDEVAEQVAALRAAQDEAARSAGGRSTLQLAAQLMGSIDSDAVFSTPHSARERIESWAPTITPDEVASVFREKMAVDHPLFFLSTTIPQPQAASSLPREWAIAARRNLEPPPKRPAPVFAYTDFGAPGEVAVDRRLPDIDTRLVTYSNNVRLNLKRTDYEPGIVRISLRISGGLVGLEDAPLGLGSLMEAFSAGGLEAHSSADLRSILSGHKVQAGLSASPTAFGAIYSTTPADLELQLEVAAAYLMHPGYRPEAERRWRQMYQEALRRLDADPPSAFASAGARILMAGDTRFGRAVSDGVADRTFGELKRYLEPWLTRGAIEIAIVGDIDEDSAIEAVARTLGALPEREAVFRTERSGRTVRFRDSHEVIVLGHSGEPDQAMISLFWPVDIDSDLDPQGVRTLSALASLMRIKIVETVRENLGASYSPSASFTASSAYPGLAYFVAGADLAPSDIGKVSAALRAVAGELRDGRITDDEFTRSIAPFIGQLPLHETSNAYWLTLISQAQSETARMEQSELPALERGARAITREQLVAAAQRWLGEAQVREVRVIPQRKATRVE